MQVKCSYCGQFISDTDKVCPCCGAENELLKRNANGVPQTMVELLQWCQDKHYPLESMRFFIGVNYQEPKAYGIYKDETTGNFIVYKNKADGSRAIRYEGKDEAYAVNELYMKIKEEALNQRMRPNFNQRSSAPPQYGSSSSGNHSFRRSRVKRRIFRNIFWIITVLILTGVMIMTLSHTRSMNTYNRTYQNYDSNSTYESGGSWNDDNSDWEVYNSWDDDDSSWDSNDSWDDDWDSDWDSGSDWDSDWGSDWDSDW